MPRSPKPPNRHALQEWANELGFRHFGIANTSDFDGSDELQSWLDAGCHGEMAYMARNVEKRAHPATLVPGTITAIMVGIDYAPEHDDWQENGWQTLARSTGAYVSTYARGRDYHKLVRNRLQKLADKIALEVGSFGYRVFCDSAPVMEVALASQAGLAWRGKHTLALNREQGSMFFIGSLLTDLPLDHDEPQQEHCGSCTRCIDVCPTQAIVAPYRVDARRCISYLTIELRGAIPAEMRPLIGNRIYGCDDCQLVCPWNKYAVSAQIDDFQPRNGLDSADLLDLFAWTEEQFDLRLRGSAIRRIGYVCWLRNISVALGNLDKAALSAAHLSRVHDALKQRRSFESPMLREHIDWALVRLGA